MFISSGRSFPFITLSLIESFFLLTFTRLFRLGRTFTLLLVLVHITRSRLLVMITTRRRLMRLNRRSLIRGGLVSPSILVWRTTSNNISPIDQRRRVFGFLYSRNPSMERDLHVAQRSISMRMAAVTCCISKLAMVMV